MELSDLERQRLEKLERLRERGWDPYPARVKRTHTAAEAIAAWEAGGEGTALTVAGRLRSIRVMGKSTFAHEGEYGMGYVLFTDRATHIVSLGEASRRSRPSTPLIVKALFAATRN